MSDGTWTGALGGWQSETGARSPVHAQRTRRILQLTPHRRLVALACACAALALAAMSPAAAVAGDAAAADTTPPSLTVADVSVNATSPAGAVLAAYDGVVAEDGVTLNCTRPAPATVACGDSIVSCTALDAAGLTTTKTFTVHVKDAMQQLGEAAVAAGGRQTFLGAIYESAAAMLRIKQPLSACVALDLILQAAPALDQLKQLVPVAGADPVADVERIEDVLDCERLNPFRVIVTATTVTVTRPGTGGSSTATVVLPKADVSTAVLALPGVPKTTRQTLTKLQRSAADVLREAIAKKVAEARAKAKARAKKRVTRSYVPGR